MNSFISWVGGKKSLCEIIVECFPEFYERYIEVFGVVGWVLFRKKPTAFEVFNDFNSLLVNLYRFVRNAPDELINALRYALSGRFVRDKGRRVDCLVDGVEIFGSICDYAGIPNPTHALSVRPVVEGHSDTVRSFAYMECNYWGRAIRDERYKLIMDYIPLNNRQEHFGTVS